MKNILIDYPPTRKIRLIISVQRSKKRNKKKTILCLLSNYVKSAKKGTESTPLDVLQ